MSRTFLTRPAALVALVALVVLVLAACGGADDADDAGAPGAAASGATAADEPSAAPVSGGRLALAYFPDNAAFACVDPFQTYWIEHRTVIRNIADSLTDQDPETGEIVPSLATDWTVDPSGLAYTFTLRTGVTFSDGTDFTADSVKLAFDNHAATLAELPTAFGAVYLPNYASTEVVDADTVTIRLSSPNAAFLQATSTTNLAILAASSYEATPEERCLGNVVGSGPFVLDSYTPGEGISLSKRDGYAWGSQLRENTGEAYLDGIDITYVAEDSVRIGQLTSGAIDIAWPRNPITENDVAQLQANGDRVVSRSLPGPANNYYPNLSDGKILADPAVRQALQRAIDRPTFAATIFGADYPSVTSIYNVTTPYYVDGSDALAFDPEAAQALLDEAGWVPGEDGIRVKDGTRLTLRTPITATVNSGEQLLQDQLKAVGIDLQLDVITQAQRADVLSSGQYDLISTYFTRGDPGVLQFIVDSRYAVSKAQADNSLTPEQAAEVQALLDLGITTSDTGARAEVFADLQAYYLDNALAFPTFERVQTAGVAPQVRGFRFTSEAFGDFAGVWLAEDS